jgi:type III secretion protein V
MSTRLETFASITQLLQKRSDVVLVIGVVGIIAAMVIPLPHALIDALVAINISIGVALLFMAVYITTPTAFAAFPSVLLVTTLFRLAVTVSTARAILIDADAGRIIETFGNSVAGGNLVVGLVLFTIITLVQFMVVAKGAERVAEVAARFSLDAMPGKQLSIDSDLRSGLIDKDEARRKRKMLELESQLHGALDGAMKFVKNDAIVSIIIIIICILAGLAVGMLMKDMPIGEAFRTYSILTVGEGMVAQVPALFAALAAGLIVTRTQSDGNDNLGEAISAQVFAQPKVFLGTGVVALLMMAVPGFPAMVFAILSIILITTAYVLKPSLFNPLLYKIGLKGWASPEIEVKMPGAKDAGGSTLAAPLTLQISADLTGECPLDELRTKLAERKEKLYLEMGVPVPDTAVVVSSELRSRQYRVMLFDVPIAQGFVPVGYSLKPHQLQSRVTREMLHLPAPEAGSTAVAPPESPLGTWVATKIDKSPNNGASAGSSAAGTDASQAEKAQKTSGEPQLSLVSGSALVVFHVNLAVKKHLGSFLGIQEVNQLLTRMAQQYPDLVKESLRILPLQRIADVLRRLVEEDIAIRNMRDILEGLVEWGSREKDIVMLAEYVRHGLKRYLSDKYAGPTRSMRALLLHPEVEEHFRRALQVSNVGTILALDPESAQRFVQSLRATIAEANTTGLVLLTAMDIRRYVRKLIDNEFSALPVLAYGELESDIRVEPVGNVFM